MATGTIGMRIQQMRKKAGFSQKQLGEKLGLSASMIGQWENDLRKPKIETLFRIADALNANIGDLYDFSIQEEKGRTLDKINEIKDQLSTAEEEEREGLEYALALLEDSYDDIVFAAAFQQMIAHTSQNVQAGNEKLNQAFDKLNDVGQQEAVKRVEELTEIPRYRRQDAPQPPAEASRDNTDTPTPEEPAEGPPEASEGTK